jgi:hypothetical protein
VNPNLKRGGPGRPPGTPNKITRAARDLAENILDDEYIERLKQRVKAGKAPHMETLLWQYWQGKPKGPDDGAPQQTLINVLAILGDLPQDTLRQLRDTMRAKALPE